MRDHRMGSSMVCLVTVLLCTVLCADNRTAAWAGDVDAGADKSFRPIVFVHGFAGSGEQYEHPAKLFASNGYPPTWITNYDYNSTGAMAALCRSTSSSIRFAPARSLAFSPNFLAASFALPPSCEPDDKAGRCPIIKSAGEPILGAR